VGSLWPVNDISTALLMERFYYFYRQENQPPAAALRAAQRWLRDATNQELSQVFQRRIEAATDRSRMPYALAREKFDTHTTRNPQVKPFTAPRFWAAFTFHGV
jgi:CHAT domain-containing protein